MRREYKEFSDEIYEIKQRIENEIVEMFKENGVERIELNRGFHMVWAAYRLSDVYVTGLGCKVEGSNVDIRFYDEDGNSYGHEELINDIPVLTAYNAAYDYFSNKCEEDFDDEEEDEDPDFEINDGVAIIPEGTTEIGDYAFCGCDSLESVTIPESVTEIGEKAFSDCCLLESIAIPKSVTKIGDYAFGGCDSLESVTIPESVTKIGEKAFSDCCLLESIAIPKSVTKIGDLAFVRCTSLESIVVADDNPAYDSRKGCNAIIETETNTLIAGCDTTIIPESVTKIGRSAFNSLTSLESVVIPEGVTEIGRCAFWGCESLTTVTLPVGVEEIDETAFDECMDLTTIYVPVGEIDYYKERLDEELHDKIVELKNEK